MSNRKEPINLIIAKGNRSKLSKKEIEERKKEELQVADDNIVPPDYLPATLKKEFIRISRELQEINIISNLDNEALARFIVSEYNYQKCSKKLLKMSVDNPQYGDILIYQDKLFKMTRQAAQDLGLTISSRCKLVIPKSEKEEKESSFESRFGGV